jgi:regulator of cell morphogenesis and NO signaling
MESSPRVADPGDQTPSSPGTTVRDFVLEKPAAVRVFETLGIDCCCGGDQSLAEAFRLANRSAEEVSAALQKLDSIPSEQDWRNASLRELAQHIVDKHHAFIRAEITRLTGLISKVLAAHGKNHQELAPLQSVFERLSEELNAHMMKEEELLFPYIIEMEDAARVKRPPRHPCLAPCRSRWPQ